MNLWVICKDLKFCAAVSLISFKFYTNEAECKRECDRINEVLVNSEYKVYPQLIWGEFNEV